VSGGQSLAEEELRKQLVWWSSCLRAELFAQLALAAQSLQLETENSELEKL